MKHPRFKYIAVALGGANKRREVVDLRNLKLPNHPVDCYQSWCRYDRGLLNYWKLHKHRIAGFNSRCYSDFLPIDIDNSHDIDKALQTCRNFLRYLESAHDVPLKALRVYFSGYKGFSVEIPTALFGKVQPTPHIPAIFKAVTEELSFDDFDLGFYKRNGLWRLPNSRNSRSGLYKIPLTVKDLFDLSIEEIKERAGSPIDEIMHCDFEDWWPIESLVALFQKCEARVSKDNKFQGSNKSRTGAIGNVEFDGVRQGERNNETFRIARKLKSQGTPLNEAKVIVKEWNGNNDPPEQDIQSLYRTVESAYTSDISDSGSIEITNHLRNDPYYNSFNNDQKVVYVHLITHLNEVKKIVWNKYTCYPNQMIFSYRSLAANAGVSEQTVRTLLKKLRECGRISMETVRSEKGYSECSRLTFHCFDLTQHLTQDSSLSNGEEN